MPKFFLTIPLLLLGAGCLQVSAPPAPGQEQIAPASETLSYQDKTLGLSITYPAAWGEVTAEEEQGMTPERAKLVEEGKSPFSTDCVVQRTLAFSLLDGDPNTREVFLSSRPSAPCESLGRGGYFGDQVNGFTSALTIQTWCEQKNLCRRLATKDGEYLWHAYTAQQDVFGTMVYDVDEYVIFRPTYAWPALLFSNQRFSELGRRLESPLFEEMVRSVKLY